MAFLCPGICRLKKDEALDKIPDECDTPYHNFQIGIPASVKWKSKQYDLHDKVALTSTDVPEADFWRVEREVNEALWSFHVISAQGKKLYVSYDESNNDVTLELSNDDEGGKKRLFELLAQKDGGRLIRAQGTTNRYIGIDGEILGMFEINDPPESMRWLIVEYFDVVQPLMDIVCEVKHYNEKWISDSPTADQPIPVRQKGNLPKKFQEWNMFRMTLDTVKFSPVDRKNLFVTCVVDIPDAILLEEETDPDITEFKMVTSDGLLKWESQWVSVSKRGKNLIRVDDELQAVRWTFTDTRIAYKKIEDECWYFPPLDCDATE